MLLIKRRVLTDHLLLPVDSRTKEVRPTQLYKSAVDEFLTKVFPRVLARPPNENQWPLSLNDPAEPGGKGRTQYDGNGAGNVAARKISKRADVDYDRTCRQLAATMGRLSGTVSLPP